MAETMVQEIEEHTPKTGANLVGIDPHGRPGEMMYLVAHYETREEAETARKLRLKSSPKESLTILEAKPRA